MSDQIPKEAKIISLLLANSAITECEPKVISFLMEFIQSTPCPLLHLFSPFNQNHSRVVDFLGSCGSYKCDVGGCQTGDRIQFQDDFR